MATRWPNMTRIWHFKSRLAKKMIWPPPLNWPLFGLLKPFGHRNLFGGGQTIASSITHCASLTNLSKLDVIQRAASRIITNSNSRAHAAPLMIKLGLEELGERRKKKIMGLVENILDGQSHPYFEDFFISSNLGQLKPGMYGYNHKRFSYYGLQIYKETRSN